MPVRDPHILFLASMLLGFSILGFTYLSLLWKLLSDPAQHLPYFLFFFQAEDGIRDYKVTGVQTCALPISRAWRTATTQRFLITSQSRKPKVRPSQVRQQARPWNWILCLPKPMSPWPRSSKSLIGILPAPNVSFAGRWPSTRDTPSDCSGMRNCWRIWRDTTKRWP